MTESGQLERIIIGEGPTAGKPISAVRIGEPSKEIPFCTIPSIRWRDNGHTFVVQRRMAGSAAGEHATAFAERWAFR